MKTVAVIIPAFNRWPTICTAIDSVLNQSYKKTECVVVDDASTDSTTTFLKGKYGSSVTIVAGEVNRGQSYCRNLGVKICDSDYVCFLDSDDVLKHDAVEQRVSLSDECREDVCVSFGIFQTSGAEQNNLLHKKMRGDKLFLEEYLEQITWCNNNGFLIDREVFLTEGMYDSRLRNKEDVELIIRLLGKFPFYYCGTEIGEVRDICGSDRARHDHEGIVTCGTIFSEIVIEHDLRVNILSNEARRNIVCSDKEEVLRSLYKLGRYSEYRSSYRDELRCGNIRNKKRFLKRFWFSYVKECVNNVLC